jgi:dimethylargininase
MTPVPGDPPRAAIVRPPGRSFTRALSQHPMRASIDPERAAAQHAAYVAALADLVRVVPLPALEDLPDACFVDDCAVVVGDRALLTRPGAPSRAGEPERLRPALAGLVAEVRRMTPPATLDGGDVLRLDRTLVVGGSRRTNRAGVEQLARFARSCGLEVAVAAVPDGVLHLQTAVTALAGDAVVGSASMLAQPAFRSVRRRVQVPPEEARACNVLAVGTTAVLPAGCPATAAAIRRLGLEVREVDVGEFHKADGGATCLALLA